MPEPEEGIEICSGCGVRMDVSAIGTFSVVICSKCGGETLVNTRFGPYTVVNRITDGGMSVVYTARDETLGREVALKVLNETYSADERRIAAFEEEARLTASFTHPHVVKVFTTGRAMGRFYIAMELVPGGHFESRIHKLGKVPETEVIALATQVAGGLEAARAAGLIHRDIKPGNLLLDGQGNVKIVDFGLALVTKAGKAKAKEIWATPYYVPPETIEGREEDFRSDIYAFGATLYHALAGKPSCDEPSMETKALLEAKRKVLPLREAAPEISSSMAKVVDRAMAYEPADRFSSYAEMMEALSSVARGEVKAFGGKMNRKWIAAAVGFSVGLAIVIGVMNRDGNDEIPKIANDVALIPEEPEEMMDEAVMESIGRRYREARTALDSGQYPEARRKFESLRDDEQVKEPTGSFAAVEAVLACYLEGMPDDGRAEAQAALTRLDHASVDRDSTGRLRGVLEKLANLDAIELGEIRGEPEDVLAAMLAGLKNWEQGMSAEAVDVFEKVTAAEIEEDDQWVAVYQRIAADYLVDAELLASPVFSIDPEGMEARDAALRELDALSDRLKTKGRAQFKVTEWQRDLMNVSQ